MRITPLLCLALACGAEEIHEPDPAPDPTAWTYEMLTDDEREVVERERDAGGWDRVHRGFADAVHEQAFEETGR